MKRWIVAAMIFGSAAVVTAQDQIRVYVSPLPTTTFVDEASKLREKTHAAMVKELQRKQKTLTLVEKEDEAQVVVELTGAGYGDSSTTETKANILTRGATTKTKGEFTAVAKLRVAGSDYSTELVRRNPYYAVAGGGLGEAVDKWIKENRASFLK
jgi:hypothetical protein